MLLKLFKSNHPAIIFLIPLTAIIFWLPSLFNTPVQIQNAELGNTTFVFNWLIKLLSFHPKASVFLALILVILEAYMLIPLNFKYIFIDSKTYLPSLLFVLFASLISSFQMLHPLLIANLFILLAIDKAFLFEKSKNNIKRYYESGFFLGLGSLFYPNIYVFIVIIWLTQIILRTFDWREWFSSIIGLITPFIFYLGVLFLTNGIDGISVKLINSMFSHLKTLPFSNHSIIAIAFLIFIVSLSFLVGVNSAAVKKISTRKYFTMFFLFTLHNVVLFFVHPTIGYEIIVALAIPLSIVCSIYFFVIKRKWVGEVIFDLTLLSAFTIIWFQ